MYETILHFLLLVVQRFSILTAAAAVAVLLVQEWIQKWRDKGYTLRQIADGLDLDIRTVERMASGRTKMPKRGTLALMQQADRGELDMGIPQLLRRQQRLQMRQKYQINPDGLQDELQATKQLLHAARAIERDGRRRK